MDQKPNSEYVSRILGIVNSLSQNKHKTEMVLQILDKINSSGISIDDDFWGLVDVSATIKKGNTTNIKVSFSKNYQIN